ncbi:MAG: methylated-DNA--[protein]-cysteine S-methyltransferase [Ignavibacteriota bacterium]|nr:MAG: methylated-DNA--[protein]-cysteine S-methyltransferase [Chlorobiota bacterium]MBE7476165.1 methylated-DNA--[protein]-cysteine S-methyltransferase [Ignavibacteriales bacterium]MBL1124156.1 methylated-DNA--[protein]-cysteine S-methyltransferase [Ignavibacteriota bacterium]MCE7857655.1 methylated-DNA--[protein]-cysteine S-methyltransferase [Ignavibacteria bacterium CHB3]MEB2297382.1 methylated-DNA--[protein]-cysteine S-methyltransferase [Ignavibacteria bacterium]NUM62482.1 methylated-DNA-
MTNQIYYASDIINGITLDVIVSEKGIREILINKKPESDTLTRATQVAPEEQSMKKIFRQLKEYFNRERREFELSLEIIGTDFQKKVWDELTKIPYGETISYGELAVRLGDKNKMRAVAAANGANPIPVIIPCHRVIGADGSLTGYGGGLDVKKKLLELEGRWTMDLFIPS